MSMTNKQLKELLRQYPDESIIYVRIYTDDDNDVDDCRHITSVNVEYMNSDLFEVPDIILN